MLHSWAEGIVLSFSEQLPYQPEDESLDPQNPGQTLDVVTSTDSQPWVIAETYRSLDLIGQPG